MQEQTCELMALCQEMSDPTKLPPGWSMHIDKQYNMPFYHDQVSHLVPQSAP